MRAGGVAFRWLRYVHGKYRLAIGEIHSTFANDLQIHRDCLCGIRAIPQSRNIRVQRGGDVRVGADVGIRVV